MITKGLTSLNHMLTFYLRTLLAEMLFIVVLTKNKGNVMMLSVKILHVTDNNNNNNNNNKRQQSWWQQVHVLARMLQLLKEVKLTVFVNEANATSLPNIVASRLIKMKLWGKFFRARKNVEVVKDKQSIYIFVLPSK